MPAAILNQGLTSARDAISSLVSHVALSDDATAFAATQTVTNPGAGSTVVLTKAATTTVVNTTTVDKTITVNGSTELTGKVINTIAGAKGTATTGAGTDTLSRIVRGAGLGIGVQAGDSYTIGVRIAITDVS